jgi:hypothetical protein
MGASIHINGTKSSIIDTVLVCRSTGKIRSRDFETGSDALERMLGKDIADLERAGHKATSGDARCMLLGHMVRLAIWQLRSTWESSNDITEKLKQVKYALNEIYPLDFLSRLVNKAVVGSTEAPLLAHMMVSEEQEAYDVREISF